MRYTVTSMKCIPIHFNLFVLVYIVVVFQIMSIQCLDTLVNLKRLDLSFNRIRKLDGLENLLSLEWLDVRANSISNMDEVSALSKVDSLVYLS